MLLRCKAKFPWLFSKSLQLFRVSKGFSGELQTFNESFLNGASVEYFEE